MRHKKATKECVKPSWTMERMPKLLIMLVISFYYSHYYPNYELLLLQNGQTPLHLAAEHDRSDVVKMFLKKNDLVTLANAVGFYNVKFNKQLLILQCKHIFCNFCCTKVSILKYVKAINLFYFKIAKNVTAFRKFLQLFSWCH